MTELEVSAKYFTLPKFTGTRFSLYKMQILAYLEARGLLWVVENPVKGISPSGTTIPIKTEQSGTSGTPAGKKGKAVTSSSTVTGGVFPSLTGLAGLAEEEKAETPAEKENVRKSLLAYNLLLLSLGEEQLQMLVGIPRGNAYGVWCALLARYERKTVASKMKLRNELHNIKMKSNENIDIYIARIKQLMLSLADMGSPLSTDELVYVLFKGLPSEYSATIDTLSLNDKLDFESACDHIRDRYERIQINEESDEINTNNSLIAYVKDENTKKDKDNKQNTSKKESKIQKTCKTCGKHGHIPFYCHENKNKLKCNYCKKVGHEQKNCWFLKREDEKPKTIDITCNVIDTDEEYLF